MRAIDVLGGEHRLIRYLLRCLEELIRDVTRRIAEFAEER